MLINVITTYKLLHGGVRVVNALYSTSAGAHPYPPMKAEYGEEGAILAGSDLTSDHFISPFSTKEAVSSQPLALGFLWFEEVQRTTNWFNGFPLVEALDKLLQLQRWKGFTNALIGKQTNLGLGHLHSSARKRTTVGGEAFG